MRATDRNRFVVLLGLMSLAIPMLSGCVTTGPRCQVAVSNVSPTPLANLRVAFTNGTEFAVDSLPAQSDRYFKPAKRLPGRNVTLSWQREGGKSHSHAVTLDRQAVRGFRGRVYFQIDALDRVEAFVLPDLDDGASPMPWGKPENWEGTIGIPGLTGEE